MENLLVPVVYLGLFVGCMIKGGAVVVAAVFASELGYIELPLVMIVAIVSTALTDHLFYFIGKKNSRSVFWKRPELIPYAEGLYEKLKENPLRVLVYHQFFNGFTQKIPYLAGTSNLTTKDFIRYDLLASAIWVFSLSLFTLALHSFFGGMLGEGWFYEIGSLLFILVFGLLAQLYIHVQREKACV